MCAQQNSGPRRLRRAIRNALIALVIGLVGLGAAEVLSGRYQVRPVLSGSMRPGLPVGGVVITKRVPISSLHVRDVVVFHRPDRPQELVVHRIVSLTLGADGMVVQTQGDANNAPDPWKVTLRGGTAYRAAYSLPLVGYAAVWIHNPTGRRTLLVLGILLLLGVALTSLVNRQRHATRIAAENADGAGEGERGGAPSDTVTADPFDTNTDSHREVESTPSIV
jgi:signal peptidase I